MKEILLLLSLYIGVCTNVSAQNLVKDFFKSQSQKGTKTDTLNAGNINDTILYVDPHDATTHKRVTTSIDSTYLQTIKDYVFLLRQDYCLYDKKRKKYYGYEGQEMFGTTYSIGLRCKNFNVILDEAVHPWEYDSNYLSFKDTKLEPVVTDSYYSLIGDTDSCHYIKTDSIISITRSIKEKYAYMSAPWVSNQDGFTINTSDTCKTGIIIWVVNGNSNGERGFADVTLKTTLIKGEMFGSINVIPPVNSSQIIGGFYLTDSKYSTFPYQLTGIVALREEKWTLNFPFKNFQVEEIKTQSKVGKLTEIKKTITEIKK